MDKEAQVTRAIQLVINHRQFIEMYRKGPQAFTRSRKLSFGIVVGTLLQLAKKSLQIECNLMGDRMNTEPASKQAFSKARYNIRHEGFIALNHVLRDQAYRDDSEGMWKGFRVLGTDGSVIRLPENEETAQHFGRHNSKGFNKGKDPIMARISEVVELTTGIVVNAAICPTSSGERIIAEGQIEEVTEFFKQLGQDKLLFVFDRGYVSREFIRLLLDLDVDFVFRVPRKFNNQVDSLADQGDCDVPVDIGSGIPTLRLTVRQLPSDERCVLLSSLADASTVTEEDLLGIYWLRWMGCEEGYKRQKVALELENFSGNGLEAVLQDFWATVVAANLFQIHCLGEEGAWDINNPPVTRINRSVVHGSLREPLFRTIIGELSPEAFKEKFLTVARRSKYKLRPGRSFYRDGVRRKKEKHVYRRVC